MKSHVEITLSELNGLAAPLLNCIQKIEAAQNLAETHHDLNTVTLENEHVMRELFQSTAESVAELMNCHQMRHVTENLESVYSNINARSAQVTMLADQLRR